MSIIKDIISLINREVPIKILEKRGLKIGKNFSKQQGCFIDPTHCFLIEIGDNVTFCLVVYSCPHDASSKKLIDKAKFGKIIIHDNVFVGANVTILPNVEIGENAIIGAGSIVTKDVPANTIVAGNPAVKIGTVDEYQKKLVKLQNSQNCFGQEYTTRQKVTGEKKEELKKASQKYGICFIE